MCPNVSCVTWHIWCLVYRAQSHSRLLTKQWCDCLSQVVPDTGKRNRTSNLLLRYLAWLTGLTGPLVVTISRSQLYYRCIRWKSGCILSTAYAYVTITKSASPHSELNLWLCSWIDSQYLWSFCCSSDIDHARRFGSTQRRVIIWFHEFHVRVGWLPVSLRWCVNAGPERYDVAISNSCDLVYVDPCTNLQ